MIFNALDEVLFWDEIKTFKDFMLWNVSEHYPHDPEGFRRSKDDFFSSHIPTKEAFIQRIERYAAIGAPAWVSGRNLLSDDIGRADMVKAITVSATKENGEKKAAQASKWMEINPDFWNYYSDNILHAERNFILELTIGAGGGTNAVMSKMKVSDYYMGVDIDFGCAKNADAIAKYYGINGLGIATSLWNLPFEDEMFTSVCSNAGLEECREIEVVISEAKRVLVPSGRLVLHCINLKKSQSRHEFEMYGFSEEEMKHCLKKARLYSGIDDIVELASYAGLKLKERMDSEKLGTILVFEK